MKNENIILNDLNFHEGLRYLGYGNNLPEENIEKIIKVCEKEILQTAEPCFVYKVFDWKETDEGIHILGTTLTLKGNSIKEHIRGCEKIILMCVTLSSKIDMLIRKSELSDMTKTVILDAFSSVAVEQACEKAEAIIKKNFKNEYFTYRYGLGYGDLPLSHEPLFLDILNAQKRIGVTVSPSLIMMPRKTVSAIIGISNNKITSHKKGCITCNMKEKCKFRIKGERCGF